jgi:cytochrome P450 family 4
MFFAVLIVFILTLLLWYEVKYRHRNNLLTKIPSHKKLPIIHNALIFRDKSLKEIYDWLKSSKVQLGPVYHYTFTPFDDGTVIVSDPKVAEGILTSNKLLDKGFDYDLFTSWLGTGLIIATGKKWHQRRKILTPAFHFQILEKFAEIMDEQGRVFVENFNKYSGEEVDVFPLVNSYALDVICGEKIRRE